MVCFCFVSSLQQHVDLPARGFGGSAGGLAAMASKGFDAKTGKSIHAMGLGAVGGPAVMASKGYDATGKSIHAMELSALGAALGGAASRNTTVAEENQNEDGEYSVSVNGKVMVNITPNCDIQCQKANRVRETRKHMLNDKCTICWKYVVGKADTEWPKGVSKKGEKYTLLKMAKRTKQELPELWKVQVKIHS
jgi:hypothetical protein